MLTTKADTSYVGLNSSDRKEREWKRESGVFHVVGVATPCVKQAAFLERIGITLDSRRGHTPHYSAPGAY